MSESNLPLSFSFTWCGALQSPWTRELLRSLLGSGASGTLQVLSVEAEGFAASGIAEFEKQHHVEATKLKRVDPTTQEAAPAELFFWEIAPSTQAKLLSFPKESWDGFFESITQTLSSLRAWRERAPLDGPVEPCVVLLWPEGGRPLERPLSPWQALHETWMRSLVEQLMAEVEPSGVRFVSLPFGVLLEGLLERLPCKEQSQGEQTSSQDVSEADETKLLRWKIHRLVGTLREVVRLLRSLQAHLERFGFLRRQRLGQRFFKLSGLRLLDWETQFHRMITGWGHLLQVHNMRLLPSFMRDRLQADHKAAAQLQQLCAALAHFPQEQGAPQKAVLSSLRQEREILVAAIQHFLQEFEEIERLWKKQAGTLAAMSPSLHASSEQLVSPQT
ncbi:MAG: hypothetical protein H6728_14840 [Myxococcales bacterium]|nr:hypothetical protein [Myxococcales bacterium]